MKITSDERQGRQGGFFPSLLLLALVTHFIYYINVFNGTYPDIAWLVVVSMFAMAFGYFIGSVTVPLPHIAKHRHHFSSSHFDEKRLKRISFILLFIGILAHLVYYHNNPVSSYAESYGAGRGNGVITVFFIFVPVALVLNEYLISRGGQTGRFKVLNRVGMVLFCVLYFLVLMKRRQILLLLLAVMAVWGPKMRRGPKIAFYVIGVVVILLFDIFGKVRGYFDANGLLSTFSYLATNFDLGWLSLDQLEGKYISRTLNDVYGYVSLNGFDPSVLLGVLFIMVPRAIIGDGKPLAFPEWYTYHFYPADYARGTGYAGSMVAELYLIGGLPLLVCSYAIFGFICARMQRRGRTKDDIVGNLVYAIFIYTLILLPRYDLASLLIDVVFTYCPIVWAITSSYRLSKPGSYSNLLRKRGGNFESEWDYRKSELS
jgi:oligosaccharide repeat unit polymerase